MPCSISEPSVARSDHGLVLGDPLGEHAACFTWKRTLFHSVDGTWSAMLSTMKQLPEGKRSSKDKSKYIERCTLTPCKAVTSATPAAVAATTEPSVQGAFLRLRTGDSGASGSLSRARYQGAGAAYRLVDGRED
jgi:hypothetical protein